MWDLEGKFNWDSRLEWGPSEPAIPEPNLGSKSLQMVSAAMKLKVLTHWKKSHKQPRQHIKKQRHFFAIKDSSSQSYGFSNSHLWM